ncbi:hypothetical protein LCGC14_1529800 [marine sediment metagenome]|uniref:Uncharacterized protein n=1 Tax=marine sediment metagenome TaxID=412755 RepID=A0A0F9LX37_9ZZZZ
MTNENVANENECRKKYSKNVRKNFQKTSEFENENIVSTQDFYTKVDQYTTDKHKQSSFLIQNVYEERIHIQPKRLKELFQTILKDKSHNSIRKLGYEIGIKCTSSTLHTSEISAICNRANFIPNSNTAFLTLSIFSIFNFSLSNLLHKPNFLTNY